MNDSIKSMLETYGAVTVKPKGRSMLPFLKENRDTVIIKKPCGRIKKYDIVMYMHEDVLVLHRVIKNGNGFSVICGDNSQVTENVNNNDIIGVAVQISNDKHEICTDGFFIKIPIVFWYGFGIKKLMFVCKKILRKIRKKREELKRKL